MFCIIEANLVRTYEKPYQLVQMVHFSKPAELRMPELSGSQKLCFLFLESG